MNLNHLSLPVRDIDEASAFFVEHLGLVETDRKADAIAILEDASGFTLVLSRPKPVEDRVGYPATFHVGFFVDDVAAVDAAHGRLQHVVEAQAPRHMRGRYGFYFHALGELLFEVSAPADVDPVREAREDIENAR